MKLALYLRVSTDDQNIDMQREHLIKWAKEHSHTIFTEFVDEAKSGKMLDRPGFQSLLRSAKYKGFDGVLVYRVDRLGRKLEDMLHIFKTFEEMGLKLLSATDQGTVDRLSPAGKLQSTVLLAAAEYERDLAVERTRHGKETALSKGHYVCRPPFGYKMTEHKLVPDPEQSDKIREMFKDKANGMSWTQLSEKYNLKRSSLQTILKNPIYRTGEIRLNGKIIGAVEKIL